MLSLVKNTIMVSTSALASITSRIRYNDTTSNMTINGIRRQGGNRDHSLTMNDKDLETLREMENGVRLPYRMATLGRMAERVAVPAGHSHA